MTHEYLPSAEQQQAVAVILTCRQTVPCLHFDISTVQNTNKVLTLSHTSGLEAGTSTDTKSN